MPGSANATTTRRRCPLDQGAPLTVLGYVLAVVIGISLGLLGGGGSILTVPVLHYILGVSMETAVPMSLVVVGLASAVGMVSHHRSRSIRWDAVATFGPAAVVGAFLGGRLSRVLSAPWELGIFAVLMIAAAVSMYVGPGRWTVARSSEGGGERRSLTVVTLLGGLVGMLTGLVGVGGGFLYVPALVLLAGLPMRQAVGTSLGLILMSCASGFVSHLGRGAIDWRETAVFTALAMVGVVAGSALVPRVPQDRLRRGFAAFLLVMGAVVLWKR
ncbi:MAG: sulfite exporter TauE/SafE family protein [Gemmatimonadota bacterium]